VHIKPYLRNRSDGLIDFIKRKGKAVPLHAMEALGGEEI
jgi:hypothetical protein